MSIVEAAPKRRLSLSSLVGTDYAPPGDREGAIGNIIHAFDAAQREILILSLQSVDNYFEEPEIVSALIRAQDPKGRFVKVVFVGHKETPQKLLIGLTSLGVETYLTDNKAHRSSALIDGKTVVNLIEYGYTTITKDNVRYPKYRHQFEDIKAKADRFQLSDKNQ